MRVKNLRLARLGVLLYVLVLGACTAGSEGELQVVTLFESATVFEANVPQVFIAAGDVTNDGEQDLVLTTCCDARAAVFQRVNGGWDAGALLDGPSVTVAARPIIAPIRNDGQNWLVYTEHLGGNNGQWLRAHRYEGTALAENQDIATREGWPGHHAPAVADLDGDGALEIWYVELYGEEPNPTMHLLRRVWNPDTRTYDGGEIADSGVISDLKIRPRAGDIRADGTETLIWMSGTGRLELTSYTPGRGTADHTSALVYDTGFVVTDHTSGEIDDHPGTDIAAATWDGSKAAPVLISGGTFEATQLVEAEEYLRVVRAGDLNGDGRSEIAAAGNAGSLFIYDAETGWRQIGSYPDVAWGDAATVRWAGSDRDEVLFAGTLDGKAVRVTSVAIR